MKIRKPEKRDVVRFEWQDKIRTGVVVEIDDDAGCAAVIYGTRTIRELICFRVQERTTTATMLDLQATTYFYVENCLLLDYQQLKFIDRRCPPGPFLELAKLQEFASRTFVRPLLADAASQVKVEKS
jgi:hypothetical protein